MSTSIAYQRFLDFFNLTGRARMEGLDASYFSEMSKKELNDAFLFLKDKFEYSEESIRGMYLCDPEKALQEFAKALQKPLEDQSSTREIEALKMGRAVMADYLCRENPSAENINRLAAMARTENEDVRSLVYQVLPASPTTESAVDLLKAAIYTESERVPLASAISKFMEVYGYGNDFNPNAEYRNIYLKLRNGSNAEKDEMIQKMESESAPMYLSSKSA